MDEYDRDITPGAPWITDRHLLHGSAAATRAPWTASHRSSLLPAGLGWASAVAPGEFAAARSGLFSLPLGPVYCPGRCRARVAGDSAWAEPGRVRSIHRPLLFSRPAQPVRRGHDERGLEPEREGGAVRHLPGGGLPGQLRGAHRVCRHRASHGSAIALNAAYCGLASRALVCRLAA